MEKRIESFDCWLYVSIHSFLQNPPRVDLLLCLYVLFIAKIILHNTKTSYVHAVKIDSFVKQLILNKLFPVSWTLVAIPFSLCDFPSAVVFTVSLSTCGGKHVLIIWRRMLWTRQSLYLETWVGQRHARGTHGVATPKANHTNNSSARGMQFGKTNVSL